MEAQWLEAIRQKENLDVKVEAKSDELLLTFGRSEREEDRVQIRPWKIGLWQQQVRLAFEKRVDVEEDEEEIESIAAAKLKGALAELGIKFQPQEGDQAPGADERVTYHDFCKKVEELSGDGDESGAADVEVTTRSLEKYVLRRLAETDATIPEDAHAMLEQELTESSDLKSDGTGAWRMTPLFAVLDWLGRDHSASAADKERLSERLMACGFAQPPCSRLPQLRPLFEDAPKRYAAPCNKEGWHGERERALRDPAFQVL